MLRKLSGSNKDRVVTQLKLEGYSSYIYIGLSVCQGICCVLGPLATGHAACKVLHPKRSPLAEAGGIFF